MPENEYKCTICNRWKKEEDIEQFEPCVCKVCY